MVKRHIVKPDFDADTRGVWLGNWLTKSEKKALVELLPSAMPGDTRRAFMVDVDRALSQCAWLQRSTPEGKQKEQLEAVASHARELLQLMAEGKLHQDSRGAIRAASKDFAFELQNTEPLSPGSNAATRNNELLPYFWDTVQDIESVFLYAARQMQPSKQNRPSLNNEKALVTELARAHFVAVGKWPAFSHSKGVWFPGFVEALPERLGVRPGTETIRTVIKDLKNRFDTRI